MTTVELKHIRAVLPRLRLQLESEPIAEVEPGLPLLLEKLALSVVGARNSEQARRNAAAGELALPGDVAQRLDEITEPLKRKLGPNPDMWQSTPRIR